MTTIRRPKGEKKDSFRSLDDSQRYDILRRYKLGETAATISADMGLNPDSTKEFIANEIKGLSTIQETNKLISCAEGLPVTPINPTTLMNDKFLEDVDDKKEVYAYYYAMTGSNTHALKESGLDKYLPRGIAAKTKGYTLGIRGKYLRDLPGMQKYINDIRDMRVRDLDLSKSFIQSELVEQLEQLKELASDDPKYRSYLLKTIELLGKTMAAFSDTLIVEEATPKTGLEILMARAKAEAAGDTTITYEMES